MTDHDIQENAISPDFFATLGVNILAGRNFDKRDIRPTGEIARRSAIVNQAFVRRYLADVDPLGVRIGEGSSPDVKPEVAIVGVVADFSYRNLREDSEQAFFPMSSRDDLGGVFHVKVRGTAKQAFQSIRRMVRYADPQLPILSSRILDAQISRSLNTERLLAALSGSVGVLALLLSLIGLYGVMSFVVSRCTPEYPLRSLCDRRFRYQPGPARRRHHGRCGTRDRAAQRSRSRQARPIPIVWHHCHRPNHHCRRRTAPGRWRACGSVHPRDLDFKQVWAGPV